MSDDATLLRRYVEERSETAFAELVQRQLNLVYSAALRRCRGDAHRAAEVSQQVFTALARQAPSLARHTVLTAWLYATTRNVAVDLIRREQRRKNREQEAFLMHELFANSPPGADWECLRPVLDETMDELSASDRTAVLLRVFDQRPFAEIGAALNVTEDAARMRVDRALDKLRVLLAKRGITSTTAALAATIGSQAVASVPVGLAASIATAALGGAEAVGAGALATFLGFMSATKVTVSLGVVALLAITTAVYQVNEARAASASLAAGESETASLQSRLADLDTRLDTAEQDQAAREKKLEQLRAPNVAAPKPTAPPLSQQQAAYDATWQVAVRSDPAIRKSHLQRIEVDVHEDYDQLFRELHFTPAQVQQFVDLVQQWIVTHRLDRGDVYVGTSMNVQGATLDEITNPEFIAAVRTQFGDAAADRYVQLEKNIPERNLVNRLTTPLYYIDAPLTPQQTEQLVQIIASSETDVFRKINFLGKKVDVIDWNRVLTQAEPVLSPAQLSGLRGSIAQARVDTWRNSQPTP